MGRHAAPDDEPELAVPEQLTVPFSEAVASSLRPAGSRPLPRPRGRHSHPDESDDDLVTAIAQADTEPVPPPPATRSVPAAPAAVRKEGTTAADIRLLRTDAALRSRVIAAVVVPFVLYVLVLLAIGRMDAFAVWVWVPLVTAGIGGGLLLDKAHAQDKARARSEAASDAESDDDSGTASHSAA